MQKITSIKLSLIHSYQYINKKIAHFTTNLYIIIDNYVIFKYELCLLCLVKSSYVKRISKITQRWDNSGNSPTLTRFSTKLFRNKTKPRHPAWRHGHGSWSLHARWWQLGASFFRTLLLQNTANVTRVYIMIHYYCILSLVSLKFLKIENFFGWRHWVIFVFNLSNF